MLFGIYFPIMNVTFVFVFQNKDFSFGSMILNIEAMKHIYRETCQNTNNIVSQRVRHEMLYGSQSIQFDILGFQSINSKYCLLRSRYFWKLIWEDCRMRRGDIGYMWELSLSSQSSESSSLLSKKNIFHYYLQLILVVVKTALQDYLITYQLIFVWLEQSHFLALNTTLQKNSMT
jgi:hypothetical protein